MNLPVEEMPEYLLSYTPGRPAVKLPEGQSRLIKAGSDIVFQVHYTPNGKAAQDRSKLGVIFAAEPPRERVATLPIANRQFAIPPGDPNYRVDASASVAEPARLLRLIPHMHLRGKAFEVRLANGASDQTLLRVPRYDFRWQNAYYLSQPVELKPGMRIDCTAWFDNSSNNPANPDANAEVRWGDQSFEEMMLNYVDVAVPANAEPKLVLGRSAMNIRDRFIGVWRLISMERRYKDGRTTYPYGKQPVGRITYDRAGRMSAQLMRSDRMKPSSKDAPLAESSPDEMRNVLNGFVSYFGTFDIDEASRTVIHHVAVALNPAWVGADLRRTYEFSGDRLSLTVSYEDSSATLVWEREKD
jgi:hypothetical protein